MGYKNDLRQLKEFVYLRSNYSPSVHNMSSKQVSCKGMKMCNVISSDHVSKK